MVASKGSGMSSLAKGAAFLVVFGAIGCAGEKNEIEKELDRLRTEVIGLRTQTAALSERLGAMENMPRAAAAPAVASTAKATTSLGESPASSDRPALEVVKLGPEGGAHVSEEAHTADSPRPAQAQSAASTATFAKAKALFDKKKHEEALLALSEFITTFPDHDMIPEATFLRAQCYAQKGDKKRSVEQLEAALAMSGGTDLASDVLFELAKAKDKMGDGAGAKRARDRLRTEFSNSAAAKRLAR